VLEGFEVGSSDGAQADDGDSQVFHEGGVCAGRAVRIGIGSRG
jgi:hypothetical protein